MVPFGGIFDGRAAAPRPARLGSLRSQRHSDMNILFIGPLFSHRGGAAITCSQLLAELTRMTHSIRAISAITEEAYRNGDPMQEFSPEIHVWRYLAPFFEIDPGHPIDPAMYDDEARHLHRYVDAIPASERPDVILAGRESISFAIPALASKLGVPWVLRVAGTALREVVRGTYPPSHLAQLRDAMRAADLLTIQASHMREFTDKLGHPKVAVVPNLVDLKLFAPAPKPLALRRALEIGPEDTVVLHASNFKLSKRAGDIVDSAPAVLADNPNLVYVMVGDGPDRPGVERKCRDAGIGRRFRFTGWVDYPHMPDYLALADIVVMPSADEQQSRMYLETQAAGRVLVASDIPAARETVDHGETGLLFRTADTSDLTATINDAARDPELRARIGRRAREAVKVHALDRVARQFAAELSAVVERHRLVTLAPAAALSAATPCPRT
jgi:glycosyltransferase involved in cell wall biosynthesis